LREERRRESKQHRPKDNGPAVDLMRQQIGERNSWQDSVRDGITEQTEPAQQEIAAEQRTGDVADGSGQNRPPGNRVEREHGAASTLPHIRMSTSSLWQTRTFKGRGNLRFSSEDFNDRIVEMKAPFRRTH